MKLKKLIFSLTVMTSASAVFPCFGENAAELSHIIAKCDASDAFEQEMLQKGALEGLEIDSVINAEYKEYCRTKRAEYEEEVEFNEAQELLTIQNEQKRRVQEILTNLATPEQLYHFCDVSGIANPIEHICAYYEKLIDTFPNSNSLKSYSPDVDFLIKRIYGFLALTPPLFHMIERDFLSSNNIDETLLSLNAIHTELGCDARILKHILDGKSLEEISNENAICTIIKALNEENFQQKDVIINNQEKETVEEAKEVEKIASCSENCLDNSTENNNIKEENETLTLQNSVEENQEVKSDNEQKNTASTVNEEDTQSTENEENSDSNEDNEENLNSEEKDNSNSNELDDANNDF